MFVAASPGGINGYVIALPRSLSSFHGRMTHDMTSGPSASSPISATGTPRKQELLALFDRVSPDAGLAQATGPVHCRQEGYEAASTKVC